MSRASAPQIIGIPPPSVQPIIVIGGTFAASRGPVGTQSSGPPTLLDRMYGSGWQADLAAGEARARATKLSKVWVGLALEVGGNVAIGLKTTTGRVWNITDQDRWADFTCTNMTAGPSIGGGAVFHMVCFVNMRQPTTAEGMAFADGFSFHLDVPIKRFGKLAKTARTVKKLIKYGEAFREAVEFAEKVADSVRTDKAVIFSKEIDDVGLRAGVVRSFGGKIRVFGVNSAGGYVDL